MKITIENYMVESSEHGGFNLIELRKYKNQKTNKARIQRDTIAYSIPLEKAIKRIIGLNLHKNPNVVNLQQFLVEYKNEMGKIKNILDIEKLK